jgi:hypothetical protein
MRNVRRNLTRSISPLDESAGNKVTSAYMLAKPMKLDFLPERYPTTPSGIATTPSGFQTTPSGIDYHPERHRVPPRVASRPPGVVSSTTRSGIEYHPKRHRVPPREASRPPGVVSEPPGVVSRTTRSGSRTSSSGIKTSRTGIRRRPDWFQGLRIGLHDKPPSAVKKPIGKGKSPLREAGEAWCNCAADSAHPSRGSLRMLLGDSSHVLSPQVGIFGSDDTPYW